MAYQSRRKLITRFLTSATVSGRARPTCPATRCTEMARTDSDWTQLGVRSPESVPMGIWNGKARWPPCSWRATGLRSASSTSPAWYGIRRASGGVVVFGPVGLSRRQPVAGCADLQCAQLGYVLLPRCGIFAPHLIHHFVRAAHLPLILLAIRQVTQQVSECDVLLIGQRTQLVAHRDVYPDSGIAHTISIPINMHR